MAAEALIPGLVQALGLGAAGTAAKGTIDMMNSDTGKTKVLGDELTDKLAETPKKEVKPKETFKTPKEIQDVIDNDLYLSISNHPDKEGLLTTLGMAGLGSPELKKIYNKGAIPASALKRLSPELMKDLAMGLGITMAPQSEEKGPKYDAVSKKQVANQIRSNASYSNMMAPFEPDPDDDDDSKKEKKDKKRQLDRKVDDASEKIADAMNEKITKKGAKELGKLAKDGQRLDVKPNTVKDLINQGGKFSKAWQQARPYLEKVGLGHLIDRLYDGSFTADEMQKLSDTISKLAEVARDSAH